MEPDAKEVLYLEAFSTYYFLLRGTASEYLQKVKDVFWTDPNGKLRLLGITEDDSKARVKDTKSARASALQRIKDMKERRQLYENDPEDFAARARLEWCCSEEEAREACQPVQSMQDVYRKMHDPVGMRIFLRYPSALRELLAYLDQFFDCKSGHRKDKDSITGRHICPIRPTSGG